MQIFCRILLLDASLGAISHIGFGCLSASIPLLHNKNSLDYFSSESQIFSSSLLVRDELKGHRGLGLVAINLSSYTKPSPSSPIISCVGNDALESLSTF